MSNTRKSEPLRCLSCETTAPSMIEMSAHFNASGHSSCSLNFVPLSLSGTFSNIANNLTNLAQEADDLDQAYFASRLEAIAAGIARLAEKTKELSVPGFGQAGKD